MIAQFDFVATSPVVLFLRRPMYKDAEIVMLVGDIYHFKEEESATFQVRPCTQKEIDIEYAMRGHRAELHGPQELKRV